MDCGPPGSSVHGILQADIGVGCNALLQVIFWTQWLNPHLMSPALAGRFFTTQLATREAPTLSKLTLKSRSTALKSSKAWKLCLQRYGWKMLSYISENKGPAATAGLRKGKNSIVALGSWGAYQRNDGNELRLLHLLIWIKTLNSLTWEVRFSITIIFWCSNYLGLVA